MNKNYFFLYRLTGELDNLLRGSKLLEAFCQEKDTLVLHLELHQKEYFLEIEVSQHTPSIVMKNEFSKARKNVVGFFENRFPVTVKKIVILPFERTIVFDCYNVKLVFIIHGAHTNFLFTAEDSPISSFKSLSKNAEAVLVNRIQSFEPASQVYFDQAFSNDLPADIQTLKKDYPFFGPDLIRELLLRSEGNSIIPNTVLKNCINSVLSSNILVGIDTKSKSLKLLPETFHHNLSEDVTIFQSALPAVRNYIQRVSKSDFSAENFKKITFELKKRIYNLEMRKAKLEEVINSQTRVQNTGNMGELLAANIYRITKGMQSIDVENYYSNNEILTIPLKEELTPQQNIDVYFKKVKSLNAAIERAKDELPKIVIQSEKLKNRLNEITQMDFNQLKELAKAMDKNENKNQRQEVQVKTIKFIIDGKYSLLVGKDSKNNDLLTLHIAKPEDIWMHARGVPGSHVVLQTISSKDEIQKSVIKKAAAVAAYYSKAKNAGLVPVSYTKKKYVVKRKGSPAGQVTLTREDSLMIKPGIPDGVEIQKSADSSMDEILGFD